MSYLKACEDAFLFRKVKRNDLHGKRLLTTNEKYYLADHGLREAVCENNTTEIGLVFENMVFMELIRRGYNVTVGKVGDLEVNFIAQRGKETVFIQVCYILANEETVEREFGSLEKIKSSFPKYVISADEYDRGRDGMKHLNIRKFLLGAELG
jgi:predicted AAA+ superfamily ATPase